MTGPFPTCPKHMRFGPCGGVRADLGCEVDGRRCPFVDPRASVADEMRLTSPEVEPVDFASALPPVLVDVRYPRIAGRRDSDVIRRWWSEMAGVLDGCAALLGEHVDNVVSVDDAGPIDPAKGIEALAERSVAVVATVTGRDRDATQAEDLMRRFVSAGAAAIHCVTGDHPAALGIERDADFGTESIELLAAAARAKAPATAAESPASPGDRVGRAALKQRGSASMIILNHCGDPAAAIEFARRCRDAGVTIPLVAPVAWLPDAATAAALEAFPGLQLPTGLSAAIAASPHARRDGLARAEELTHALAASGEFAAVNLSGGTVSADPELRIDLTAEFAAAIATAWDDAQAG